MERSEYPIKKTRKYLLECGLKPKFPDEMIAFRIHIRLIEDLGWIFGGIKIRGLGSFDTMSGQEFIFTALLAFQSFSATANP